MISLVIQLLVPMTTGRLPSQRNRRAIRLPLGRLGPNLQDLRLSNVSLARERLAILPLVEHYLDPRTVAEVNSGVHVVDRQLPQLVDDWLELVVGVHGADPEPNSDIAIFLGRVIALATVIVDCRCCSGSSAEGHGPSCGTCRPGSRLF